MAGGFSEQRLVAVAARSRPSCSRLRALGRGRATGPLAFDPLVLRCLGRWRGGLLVGRGGSRCRLSSGKIRITRSAATPYLRTKVEQCADTFRKLLDHNPVGSFRDQLRQELDGLGRVVRALGGGRKLEKTTRAVDTILDEDFAPVRSRMERWVSEFDSSAVTMPEETIVIYREPDGRRASSVAVRNALISASCCGVTPPPRA